MALQLLEQMHVEGVSPDDRAFVSAVQACGLLAEKEEQAIVHGRLVKVTSLQKGKAVHSHARSKGYHSDVFVGNTLISMYGKCGSIVEAQDVFDGLLHSDIVSWNVLLAAHFEQGQAEKIFLLYEQMRKEGVCPNDRTFVSLLQTCGMHAEKEAGQSAEVKTLSLNRTKSLHADASRKGFHSDLFVGSILISAYGKCGSIMDAQNVFDVLTLRNVILWNAMLAACVEVNQADRAMHLYEQMRDERLSPDDCTFVTVLQVCCLLAEKEQDVAVAGQPMKVNTLQKGKAIHGDARSKGYGLGSFVGSTLISMYGKCGSNLDAEVVFGGLSHHNVVACNAMLASYASQGHAVKAFELYEQMQEWSVRPDEITLVCVLQSCSGAGSLDICRQIHHNRVLSGVQLGPFLATTLIHAYGRCASMVEAQNVFDALVRPDLVSWNALIAGYAREGNCVATLQCFEEMQVAGSRPDEVTFLSVVSACSHAGLVEKGVDCFESMSRDYGMKPWIEHYVCMVDLLGRAGHFSRVTDLLSTMPLPPNLGLCLCLLAACRQHGKLVLAKQAFDMAVNIEPKEPSPYILMSNMYADAGMWECAKEMKELGQQRGAWKNLPGQSWIEHEQEVQRYSVGDRKHPEVCALLQKVKECV